MKRMQNVGLQDINKIIFNMTKEADITRALQIQKALECSKGNIKSHTPKPNWFTQTDENSEYKNYII